MSELNSEAREALMSQISKAIENLKHSREDLNNALVLYQHALNLSLSEPLRQVGSVLKVVSVRLKEFRKQTNEEEIENKPIKLAELAKEINESEFS